MVFSFYFESEANCKQNSSKKVQDQRRQQIIEEEIFHNFIYFFKLKALTTEN